MMFSTSYSQVLTGFQFSRSVSASENLNQRVVGLVNPDCSPAARVSAQSFRTLSITSSERRRNSLFFSFSNFPRKERDSSAIRFQDGSHSLYSFSSDALMRFSCCRISNLSIISSPQQRFLGCVCSVRQTGRSGQYC